MWKVAVEWWQNYERQSLLEYCIDGAIIEIQFFDMMIDDVHSKMVCVGTNELSPLRTESHAQPLLTVGDHSNGINLNDCCIHQEHDRDVGIFRNANILVIIFTVAFPFMKFPTFPPRSYKDEVCIFWRPTATTICREEPWLTSNKPRRQLHTKICAQLHHDAKCLDSFNKDHCNHSIPFACLLAQLSRGSNHYRHHTQHPIQCHRRINDQWWNTMRFEYILKERILCVWSPYCILVKAEQMGESKLRPCTATASVVAV